MTYIFSFSLLDMPLKQRDLILVFETYAHGMCLFTHTQKNKNRNKTNKKITLRNNQQVKCKVPKVRTGMNKLQQVRDWYQTSSLSHTVANITQNCTVNDINKDRNSRT